MSTATTSSNGVPEASPRPVAAAARPATRPAGKRARQRHTPGGAALGQNADAQAQRLAAALLEVLAGVRTPSQAAEALGISLPRYYQVETRAVQAFVAACAPRPRGRGRSTEKELTALRRQHERLQQELSRQQTLVRLAQRSLGLAPAKAPTSQAGSKDKGGKKRRRRPVVRALHAAEALHRRSQETTGAEAVAAATLPGPAPA
jgi:hypothetical protein